MVKAGHTEMTYICVGQGTPGASCVPTSSSLAVCHAMQTFSSLTLV